MPAHISSTFNIVVNQTLSSSAVTITNPGRTLTVVSVLATGVNGADLTLRKNSGSGDVVAGTTALATGDLNDFPCSITVANATFSASDNLYLVEGQGSNITRVVVVCESGTPYNLTVT